MNWLLFAIQVPNKLLLMFLGAKPPYSAAIEKTVEPMEVTLVFVKGSVRKKHFI